MSLVNTKKRRILEVSSEILDFLLDYKNTHSDLTFSLRSKNSVQSDEERLEKGQWFQGSDYIYVPLFKKGDKDRKIKTIGFEVSFNEDGSIKNNFIEISFKSNEFSEEEISFHKELASIIGLELNANNHGILNYPNAIHYMANLKKYLDDFRPIALKLLYKFKIQEKYIITKADFERSLERIIKIKNKLLMAKEREVGDTKVEFQKNQILFGPPGTGKTFRSIKLALEIINDDEERKLDWNNWDACKSLYNRRVNEGRIGFVTFHQSMSYEDFIEGIKPVEPTSDEENLSYAIQDGIFKNICLAAANRNNLNFEFAYSKLLEDLKINENGITIKEPNFKVKINLSENGIDLDVESDTYIKKINKLGLKYVSESQRFVGTWGKNYKSIFKLLTEKYGYRNETENIKKNYVLIIDEINRGNVAQIFGELITLIEDTKRMGKPEALKVMLPYSKKYFEVPDNLYIIGTMNTADRSVEALDAALRRRFSFTEIPPETHLLNPYNRLGKAWGDFWIETDSKDFWGKWDDVESGILDLAGLIKDEKAYTELSRSWKEKQLAEWRQITNYESIFANSIIDSNNGIRLDWLLNTINTRIEKLLDKDHQIGHSYFLSVNSMEDLKAAFQNKIIPLLQEYFFGDYGKIGLVLGKEFVLKDTTKAIFADFDSELASELSERPTYTIKNALSMDDEAFKSAISALMASK